MARYRFIVEDPAFGRYTSRKTYPSVSEAAKAAKRYISRRFRRSPFAEEVYYHLSTDSHSPKWWVDITRTDSGDTVYSFTAVPQRVLLGYRKLDKVSDLLRARWGTHLPGLGRQVELEITEEYEDVNEPQE